MNAVSWGRLGGTLLVMSIASAAHADARVAVAADAGLPQVVVFAAGGGSPIQDFLAFPAGYTGGVRVALGDIDGDRIPDVIAGGGTGNQVRVFSGANAAVLRDFAPFEAGFAGGVYVAGGDVDGDGRVDIVVGTGGGLPRVRVYSGRSGQLLDDFTAFTTGQTGVRVAAGDINGDGRADLITGRGPGTSPQVKVFDARGHALLRDYLAFPQGFVGGIFVAAGDTDGDGLADLIVGTDAGGSPQIAVVDAQDLRPIGGFLAYAPNFTGGVRVAAADLDGDRVADVVSGPGAGAGPHVKVFKAPGFATTQSFFGLSPGFTGGINVAAPSEADVLLRDGFE